jgi:hypothetical protein
MPIARAATTFSIARMLTTCLSIPGAITRFLQALNPISSLIDFIRAQDFNVNYRTSYQMAFYRCGMDKL